MKKKSYFLGLCFLFFSYVLPAQKVLSVEDFKQKYSEKQALMMLKKEVIKITLDKNDSLDITLSYYSEMLHLAAVSPATKGGLINTE